MGTLAEAELTKAINGAFFRVYNRLGYGFLEAPYVGAMERELIKLGFDVGREVGVRLYYEGEELAQYRLDMVVNRTVIVEIKAGERLHPSAKRQLFNYLRATNLEIGLLFHFGPEPKFERLYCPNNRKAHCVAEPAE